MEIIKAYYTYNGIYLNKEDAMKKKNRERDYDEESYFRNNTKYYKEPTVVFLLKDKNQYFILQSTYVIV